MQKYPKTEEELIGYVWLDLAGDKWGEYAWVGPGTWCSIAKLVPAEVEYSQERGSLGDFIWVRPKPFKVKILMNPFAEEGRVYLAHAGTKYIEYTNL